MKKYLVWFFLMMKRLLKKPAFVCLLLALPLLAVGIERLGQGGAAGALVGVAIDNMENAACEEWNQEFLELLVDVEPDSILQFRVYERKEQLVRDVKRGELDCGIILPENMRDRMNEGEWKDTVLVYQTSASTMTEIVKERTASVIFTLFSEESYVNYVGNTAIFDAAVSNGITKSEISAFAKAAYDTHLLDGSTFAFVYHGKSYVGDKELVEESAGIEGIETEQTQTPDSFRLRGVLAVCIFLSGLCGLLTDARDRQEKRFARVVSTWVTTAVNIWCPTIYTSFITLFSLCLAGEFTGDSGIGWISVGQEACRLLFYQFLIVIYCSIIRVIVRKQETIAAAVPLLTLASMVCCPVWIRLAAYLPIFRVLEKFFPATYYLLL